MENHFTSHDSDTEANVDESNHIPFRKINYENNLIAVLGRELKETGLRRQRPTICMIICIVQSNSGRAEGRKLVYISPTVERRIQALHKVV